MLRAAPAEGLVELLILEVSQKELKSYEEVVSKLPISAVSAIPTAAAAVAAAVVSAASGVPNTSADRKRARASRVVQTTEETSKLSRAQCGQNVGYARVVRTDPQVAMNARLPKAMQGPLISFNGRVQMSVEWPQYFQQYIKKVNL